MTTFFTKLAMVILNNPLLASLFYDEDKWEDPGMKKFSWLKPIAEFLDDALIPVIIVVGALGAIWIIILGVNLARAETADKATEAKKRLINVVIALVAVLILIFLLAFFVAQAPTWFASGSEVNPFPTPEQ